MNIVIQIVQVQKTQKPSILNNRRGQEEINQIFRRRNLNREQKGEIIWVHKLMNMNVNRPSDKDSTLLDYMSNKCTQHVMQRKRLQYHIKVK